MAGRAPNPLDQLQDPWLEDYLVKDRLLMYFTKASATTLPVLVAFLSLTLGEKKDQEHVKIAFCFVSLLALLASTVPLACRNGLQDDPTVPATDQVTVDVWVLCAGAYISNILLIVTVAILAVLLNPVYVALTSPVLLLSFLLPLLPLLLPPLLLVGITVFVNTGNPDPLFQWRNVLHRKHATDLTFVFNVSSEVTQTSLFGLSAALFGKLKTNDGQRMRRQGEAASPKAAEALLVYAAVFGLTMMLACSMPPVFTNTRYREQVVNKIIRVAACLLVALVAAAAVAAVVTLLQGYIVFALAVVTGVSVLWFRRLYNRTPPPRAAATGPATGARHPSQFLRNHCNVVLWPGQYPAMFGALMVVYSQYNICQPIGKLYKTTVFFVFLAIVSNLARMIILREGVIFLRGGRRRNEMRLLSVYVTLVSMGLALIFVVLLVWLQRVEVKNTFFISSGSCRCG